MAAKTNKFVGDFSKFYVDFFNRLGNSVLALASIQKKYPEEYNNIIQFGEDPTKVSDMLEKLSSENKSLILQL